MPGASEDVEKLALSDTGNMWWECSHSGESLNSFLKHWTYAPHMIQHLSQRNENLCVHNNLYQNVVIAQIWKPFNRWLVKLWCICSVAHHSAVKKKKKSTIDTHNSLDGSQENEAEFLFKESVSKGYILWFRF